MVEQFGLSIAITFTQKFLYDPVTQLFVACSQTVHNIGHNGVIIHHMLFDDVKFIFEIGNEFRRVGYSLDGVRIRLRNNSAQNV